MTYKSTMALSVYNTLSLTRRDMSRKQIEEHLRAQFDRALPGDYVAQGAGYLLSKQFVTEEDGVLKIQRLRDGRGRPLARSEDSRDLIMGDG